MRLWIDDLAVSSLDTRMMWQILIPGDNFVWLWCFIPGASGTHTSCKIWASTGSLLQNLLTAIYDEHNLVCSLCSWHNLIKSPLSSGQAVIATVRWSHFKVRSFHSPDSTRQKLHAGTVAQEAKVRHHTRALPVVSISVGSGKQLLILLIHLSPLLWENASKYFMGSSALLRASTGSSSSAFLSH